MKLLVAILMVAFVIGAPLHRAYSITGPKPEFKKLADGVYAYIRQAE